jgi:hypothetical protein
MTPLSTISKKRCYPYLILAVIILFNLFIHVPFLLLDTFGEMDAARLANSSLYASFQSETPYYINPIPVFSAPLYIELLRNGIYYGWIETTNIISCMTIASFFASAAVTAMVFLFVFKLTGSILAAASSGIILQFNPTFWHSSIYGFPTILSAALFFISLLLFQSAFGDQSKSQKLILFFVSLAFFILAILVKIDSILAAAVFCLPVWILDIPRKRKIIWSAILLLVVAGCFIFYANYAGSLLSENSAKFYGQWNQNFPVEPKLLFSTTNLEIAFKSTGLVSIPLAAAAIILLVRKNQYKTIILWLVLASLPIILFWGLRDGNSARHNLIAIIFLYMVLSLPMGSAYHRIWSLALVLMCLVNYFAFKPQANPYVQSGRLIRNSLLLKEESSILHNYGKLIAGLPERKIALAGGGPWHPFYEFEQINQNSIKSFRKEIDPITGYFTTRIGYDDDAKEFFWLYTSPTTTEMIQIVENGFFVIIDGTRAEEEIYNIPQLQNHWTTLSKLE